MVLYMEKTLKQILIQYLPNYVAAKNFLNVIKVETIQFSST